MGNHQLILAVAGSGKTTYIVNQLNLKNRSLVVTYTINNFQNLRDNILEKFGHFPDNIKLMTYFSFLYSFCYCPFLLYEFKAKGITYEKNPNMYASQNNKTYFVDRNNRLYGNRIVKLLELQNVFPVINSRLSKYFDNLFIDEIQDFAGHDFNLLKSIASADIDMIFVGDFYQHTFDTSRDGNVNKNLHLDFDCYVNSFARMGFTIDEVSLQNSYRCSPSVCYFIRNGLGIEIFSNRTDDSQIFILDNQEQADIIFQNGSIVKLFYREHIKYDCHSNNWGESKGENKYNDVCVVLNKTTAEHFKANNLSDLSPQTKNKLYVACSRANDNLYFVEESYYKKYKNVN